MIALHPPGRRARARERRGRRSETPETDFVPDGVVILGRACKRLPPAKARAPGKIHTAAVPAAASVDVRGCEQ